jgi:single-stranded-DNA-specific exonuclease
LYEREIGKTFSEILSDSETMVKKGLLLYPSTRPLDRALEYSSNPFIPGVTGFRTGVLELLRDAELNFDGNRYKALYELNEEEMRKLITAVMIRCASQGKEINSENIIGNLFLVKFFNRLEDARELSTLINACSRMGYSGIVLGLCLGNKSCLEEAERVYIDYKQNLVNALRYVSEAKISGKNYTIVHGKDRIKDTIIGTVASIISHSPSSPEGMIVIALAYNNDKIKVSARITGKQGRNVREVLSKVVVPLGGEVGGHPEAAGCLISKDQEEKFLEELKKVLELEVVKV